MEKVKNPLSLPEHFLKRIESVGYVINPNSQLIRFNKTLITKKRVCYSNLQMLAQLRLRKQFFFDDTFTRYDSEKKKRERRKDTMI